MHLWASVSTSRLGVRVGPAFVIFGAHSLSNCQRVTWVRRHGGQEEMVTREGGGETTSSSDPCLVVFIIYALCLGSHSHSLAVNGASFIVGCGRSVPQRSRLACLVLIRDSVTSLRRLAG